MSWTRLTLEELIDQALADIDANLDDTDARLPVSLLSVLAVVVSGQTDGLYGYIANIAGQIPWVDADTEALERWASLVGITRKQATAASGYALASGCTADATIAADSLLQRADQVQYLVTADVTIGADGTATVPVAAIDTGTGGNASAGVKLALTETVVGIVSPLVVTSAALTGGTAAEEDADLLERFLEYWQGAEEGAGPYVKLAKQVAGVTRAWEYEHEMGLGTITIRFVMDDKTDTIIPTDAEIEAVNTYVQNNRPPGGGGVYVVAPIPDPLDLTLAIYPDTDAIRTAVIAEVTDFVLSDHECGEATYLSRLSEAIAAADGEYRHQIVSPTADVSRAAAQICVPGTITWTAYVG